MYLGYLHISLNVFKHLFHLDTYYGFIVSKIDIIYLINCYFDNFFRMNYIYIPHKSSTLKH